MSFNWPHLLNSCDPDIENPMMEDAVVDEERLARELLITHNIAREMTQALGTNPVAFAFQVGQSDRVVLEEARVAGFSDILAWDSTSFRVEHDTPSYCVHPNTPAWVKDLLDGLPTAAVWARTP